MRTAPLTVPLLFATLLTACGDDAPLLPPNEEIRQLIEDLAPSANIGHRGTGPTRPDHPFPENAISSIEEAMRQGADGVEVDVELTSDGQVIVMHDDTLDRTTDCTGCVSAMTFDEVRACALLDGDGQPTQEIPPTLEEVYDALPVDALVNVELKVFEAPCVTPTTGGADLARAAIDEVVRLGVERRTFFSSFDDTAAETVKLEEPTFYSALLRTGATQDEVDRAVELGQDALHPFLAIEDAVVASALSEGLQVNIWTVNPASLIEANINKGATAIITDEPATMVQVLADLASAN